MWKNGDRVWAQRAPDNIYSAGTIRYVEPDRYFVIFEDGDDAFVKPKQMKPFKVDAGMRVFTQDGGRNPRFGEVLEAKDNQVHLQYEDGERAWHPLGQVRYQPEVRRPRAASRSGERQWAPGDRVLACWLDLFWYPGAVLEQIDDRISVIFDHGGQDWLVAEQLRPLELREGDRVEARFRAGREFYKGRIVRRSGEVLQIDYDDGDHEVTLMRLVRVQHDDWLPSPGAYEFSQADRIFGRWFDGLWYPGIILGIEGKRVHVLFDDNDQAYLPWNRLRPLELEPGTAVQCRQIGGPFFQAAQVVRSEGERILVAFEDGQEHWTSIRLLRVEEL